MKALLLLFVPSLAAADPCEPVRDPIVTPLREPYLDAQRSACVRDELFVAIAPHALIDTPGFHGVLGGDLSLGGRLVVDQSYELSVQLRALDFAYVVNAVNEVNHAGFGPIVVGAATKRGPAAIALRLELPYTRDDWATFHSSAAVEGLFSTDLAPRWTLHSRLTALGMFASSEAGSTHRLAFRAGADLAWQPRKPIALHAGADLMAGWAHGFDAVLVRAGVHWAMWAAWRLRSGVALPLGGSDRTTAIVDLAVVHDL
jgi:hypothetical protein